MEAKADSIINFETIIVPGLLQTGEYTRALMKKCGYVPDAEIEDRMISRLHRHSVLFRRNPPDLVAIIDELVLHRLVGNRDIMRRQLEHLLEVAEHSNITIRVVPNDGRTHDGIEGCFIMVRRAGLPAVVFVEGLTSGLFLEERTEVSSYESVVRSLSHCALDKRHSAELIATMAQQLETEASDA